jgi:hypothetical protein
MWHNITQARTIETPLEQETNYESKSKTIEIYNYFKNVMKVKENLRNE